MKPNTLLLVAVCVLLSVICVLASWLFCKHFVETHQPPAPKVDTLYLPDTTKLIKEKPVRTVTAKLPVRKPKIENCDNKLADSAIFLQNRPVDSTNLSVSSPDSLAVQDSVDVDIPIVQRTYEGEHYRAVVQGYQPELVSIDIKMPEIAAPPQAKQQWWSITIGFQVGYGFTPKGWLPYAGIGGTIGIRIPTK